MWENVTLLFEIKVNNAFIGYAPHTHIRIHLVNFISFIFRSSILLQFVFVFFFYTSVAKAVLNSQIIIMNLSIMFWLCFASYILS